MPYDMAMCEGLGCPLRDACYRFRAYPMGRQDWLGRSPYNGATGTCDAFRDIQELMPQQEDIAWKAYFLWQQEGCPDGQDEKHWLEAEAFCWKQFHEQIRDVSEMKEN